MKNSEIINEIRSCLDLSHSELADVSGVSFNGNHIIRTNETVTLYHGSKSGICGTITPISREHCDFGKGFYMGTDRTQLLTLICNYPNARIYTLSVNLSGLKILDVEVGLDWVLLIAYNRDKMESVKHLAIYNHFANLNNGCDMIIGEANRSKGIERNSL